MAARYYQRSGGFSLISFILTMTIGTIAVAVLAVAYAFVVAVNPFVYINFIATLILGALLGLTIGIISGLTNSRSDRQDHIVVFLLSIVAIWAYWLAWAEVTGYGNPAFTSLSIQDKILAGPVAVFNYVWGDLTDYYTISIGRRSRAGAGMEPQWMQIIWGIETVMIIAVAWLFGKSATFGAAPYNAATKSKSKQVISVDITELAGDMNALEEALEAGDMSALLQLNPQNNEPGDGDVGTRIHLYQDAKDPTFNLLSVFQVLWTVDSDGDLDDNFAIVVRHLYITSDAANALKAHFS